MRRHRIASGRLVASLLGLTFLSLPLVACGDDDNGAASPDGGRATQAFLEAMTPHHLSAVEMAEVAEDRAEHQEVRGLARDIIAAQEREIELMAAIHERLFDRELEPNGGSYRDLGLTADEAGAGGHPDTAALRRADPFDREFIDMMVPHHQGAIRMARAVLEKTDDSGIQMLATEIVDAQSREIRRMNEWRTAWYGAASPAGGVPPASGEAGPEAGGEHNSTGEDSDSKH